MTFIAASQIRQLTTGALTYIEPKEVWRGHQRASQYLPEGGTISVVIDLAANEGGIVRCRADISNITFDEDRPGFDPEEDKVYFVIHLKTRTYWASYDYALSKKPSAEKLTSHYGYVEYSDSSEMEKFLTPLPQLSTA